MTKRFTFGAVSPNVAMIKDNGQGLDIGEIVDLLNSLSEENEQLKNELRKEKSLREYSDSMYDKDLIVNIRFSKGEWKADVSVIDDE